MRHHRKSTTGLGNRKADKVSSDTDIEREVTLKRIRLLVAKMSDIAASTDNIDACKAELELLMAKLERVGAMATRQHRARVATKKSKRQKALDVIFHEVARTGSVTDLCWSARSSGRIGHDAWREAMAAGMRHRDTCRNQACQCKQVVPQ